MNVWIVCIVGAYLIGSIPFGVLIGRVRGVDILQHGSKNPGATNVARLLGRPLGAVCFVLDMGKGAGPVLVAGSIFNLLGRRPASLDPEVAVLSQTEMWLWLAVACAAIAGHMCSPFLAFRGGKGVATGFGAMVAMWPVLTFPALGAIVVWYGVLRRRDQPACGLRGLRARPGRADEPPNDGVAAARGDGADGGHGRLQAPRQHRQDSARPGAAGARHRAPG
ncbi:MAG: glycerol-3-phosphate acyltransferase [Planctomycetota bacterium]|jgi:acyl-phosphate glycerol 3-phosphate acyltransferase